LEPGLSPEQDYFVQSPVGEFQLTYTRGDIYSPRLDNREPLQIECEHFIECVSERKKPKTDGMSGLRVVKVLELAERSAGKDGAWQKVQ